MNKKEREIRGSMSRLRRQFRDKKISKKDFDKAFGASNTELEKISNEKDRLIGEALPPMPPPPMPLRGKEGPGLDSIKRSILGRGDKGPGIPEPAGKPAGRKGEEPFMPPLITKLKTLRGVKTRAVARGKAKPPAARGRIRDVHIIRETIKEVPVIKEKIREVKVPVIKEVPVIKTVKVPVIKEKIKEVPVIKKVTVIKKVPVIREVKVPVIKEVPVIKTVKVPAGDPDMARKIESSFKEINNIKLDVARQGQELSQISREIGDIKQHLKNLDDMKSELRSLGARTEKTDFQGLTQEIYSQFEKMNSSIRESEKRTDDLAESFNVEVKTLKEKMGEATQAKERVDGLDISNIRRDMESLKQKSQYIEQHLDKFDVEPIVEMIREVENKVNNLRASSALIIE